MQSQSKKSIGAKISYWLYRIILAAIALLIFVRILIVLPPVQNFVVQHLTNYLNTQFDARFQLEYVNIDWFDRLVLEDFKVFEKNAGEAELEIGRLYVNILSGLWHFIKHREINIRHIAIRDAKVRLIRPADEKAFVLVRMFAANPDREKKATSEIYLNLQTAAIENLTFDLRDSLFGTQVFSTIRAVNLELSGLDFRFPAFQIQKAHLTEPDIAVILFKGSYVRPDSLPINNSVGPDSSLCFTVDRFTLGNGKFSLVNERIDVDVMEGPYIDFSNLNVDQLNIELHNFLLDGPEATGKIANLSLKEGRSGFELINLRTEASIMHGAMRFNELEILTSQSKIGPQLSFEYDWFSDFSEFVDKVYMRGSFDSSYVHVKDVIAFAPALSRVDIFKNNKDRRIFLEGDFRGTINSLRIDNLRIELSPLTAFYGSFRSRNLAVPQEQFINLTVDRLNTTILDMRRILPRIYFPNEMNKLARFQFQGRFDGFFTDFVANGELSTALGKVESDLRLNLKPGIERATYKGQLDLYRFDLGEFFDNPDLGPITLTSGIDGRGLTIVSAKANLNAEIREFSFRDYPYNNITLAGIFDQNRLDIDTVSIRDDHIHLDFSGLIELSDSLPLFQLSLNVQKLELLPLNLSKEDIRLAGILKADFKGITPDDFDGFINADNLSIQRDTLKYDEDRMRLNVDRTQLGRRRISLETNAARAEVEGVFNFAGLKNAVFDFIYRYYPVYAERFDLNPPMWEIDSVYNPGLGYYEEISRKPFIPANQAFSFNVSLRKSNEALRLINPSLLSLQNFFAVGYFDNITNRFLMESGFSNFTYEQTEFRNVTVDIQLDTTSGHAAMYVQQLHSGDTILFEPVDLDIDLAKDSIHFVLETKLSRQPFNTIGIDGNISLYENLFQISLNRADVEIFEDIWQIRGGNYFRFGTDYLQARNFEFKHDERTIKFSNKGRRGMVIDFEHFDLSLLEAFIKPKNINYQGDVNAHFIVSDIFKMTDIEMILSISDLIVNEYNWGNVEVQAGTRSLDEPVSATIDVAGNQPGVGDHAFNFRGRYYLPVEQVHERLRNTFTFDAALEQFPLVILEYVIQNGISDTKGKVSGLLFVSGDFAEPNIRGELNVTDAATSLDFLGTRYFLPEGKARVSNDFIDFTGMVLEDRYGNKATANGGLRHRFLKDFELEVTVRTSRFEFLNTTRSDNEVFYGTAFGAGHVEFSGTFPQPSIFVSATSGTNTRIAIPITSEQTAEASNFITFVKRNGDEEDERQTGTGEVLGVNLEMELNITPEAQVQLIFDERTGDIIQGRGRGNVRILLNRLGTFSMYGDYIIDTGDYLFTYQSFINKPFSVRSGGTIQWDGDPYNARINIEAVYDGLKTAPINLIAEYITTEQERALAAQTTTVEVVLKLTGELLQPEITFDIFMPELDFVLRSYVESKLRTLREDQNELSRQVFGLVVVGSFLPSNTGSLISNPTTTGINTFSQVISNQFSNYLTDLLGQVVRGDGVLSGIDLDINYRMYDLGAGTGIDPSGNGRSGQELQLGLRNYLFDRRLIVNIGGNFGFGETTTLDGPLATGSMITGDIVVEYLLTRDGRLRIRGFQRSQEDGLGERRSKTGISLSYRKEFDTFSEFASDIVNSIRGKD